MSIKSTNTTGDSIARNKAKKATKKLRCPKHEGDDGYPEYRASLEIAQRWRSQHVHPTESCFRKLLGIAQQFPDAVLSFRLKRLKSITDKIQRPGKHYELGTMDDIGGCRLILSDMGQLDRIVPILKERVRLKRQGSGVKNYIESPRSSGYRSCHLITLNEYNGRDYYVEVQVRTRLQHLWSTAVETASLVYEYPLKEERPSEEISEHEREIREFFAIVSSLFAIEEGTAQVQGYCESKDVLAARLSNLGCLNGLLRDLSAASDGVYVIEDETNPDSSSLYLLTLSRDLQSLQVRQCSDGFDAAIEAYNQSESGAALVAGEEGGDNYNDTVLAYAENRSKLLLAFPNYSANVKDFLVRIENYIVS